MYFSHNGTYLPPISGRTPSRTTAAVGFNENATLPFQPGKTYRLRVINTSALVAFHFWIDGHQMRIIEADGVRLSPRSSLAPVDPPVQTDTEEYPIDLVTVAV